MQLHFFIVIIIIALDDINLGLDKKNFYLAADKGKVTVEIIPPKNAELLHFYHTENITELEVHLSSTETKGKGIMSRNYFRRHDLDRSYLCQLENFQCQM